MAPNGVTSAQAACAKGGHLYGYGTHTGPTGVTAQTNYSCYVQARIDRYYRGPNCYGPYRQYMSSVSASSGTFSGGYGRVKATSTGTSRAWYSITAYAN